MRYTSTGAVVGIFLLLVSTSGCGKPFYQVKGKITFEGQPLKGGGTITFVPTGDQRMAGGEISEDGTYTLSTASTGDGVMPGDFRVAIVQVTDKEPEMVPDGQKVKKAPASTVALPDRIPLIYADQAKSPLTAKVEAKSPNEINFDLKRNIN